MADDKPTPITMAGVLADADKLAADLKAVKARIAANRQLATLLVKNGAATKDEAEKVAKIYPSHKAENKTPS